MSAALRNKFYLISLENADRVKRLAKYDQKAALSSFLVALDRQNERLLKDAKYITPQLRQNIDQIAREKRRLARLGLQSEQTNEDAARNLDSSYEDHASDDDYNDSLPDDDTQVFDAFGETSQRDGSRAASPQDPNENVEAEPGETRGDEPPVHLNRAIEQGHIDVSRRRNTGDRVRRPRLSPAIRRPSTGSVLTARYNEAAKAVRRIKENPTQQFSIDNRNNVFIRGEPLNSKIDPLMWYVARNMIGPPPPGWREFRQQLTRVGFNEYLTVMNLRPQKAGRKRRRMLEESPTRSQNVFIDIPTLA